MLGGKTPNHTLLKQGAKKGQPKWADLFEMGHSYLFFVVLNQCLRSLLPMTKFDHLLIEMQHTVEHLKLNSTRVTFLLDDLHILDKMLDKKPGAKSPLRTRGAMLLICQLPAAPPLIAESIAAGSRPDFLA